MKRRLRLARSLGGFLLLAAFVASGAASGLQRLIEPWASGPEAVVALYVAALALAAELISLPLDYYSGFALEHRFGLSNQSLKGWLADEAKGFSLNLALTLVAAEILFWLLRTQPATWWLWASAFFIAVAVVLTNLAPVLILPIFYKFEPLEEEEELKERLMEICRRADTQVRGVFRWGLSAKTKAANAALVGWGNTRRVLLADTLIESFEPAEVVGVFAHELGHHVRGHIWQGMALQSALTLAFFSLLGLAAGPMSRLQGLSSPAEVAILPSMMLMVILFSGGLFPLLCAWSRHHEWQADSYAVETGGEPEAYARALERLCALNLAELDPPRWVRFLFGTHPAPGERIRAARAAVMSA